MDRSFALRKGSWTEEEDILLRRCIDKYGEGNWGRVPLRAGLRRCRKSCRLRWVNYLRPNIKRRKFAQDEVDLLLRLHKLLGNRWSLIAGRLPGRTANDIKNYWNTRFFNRKTSGTIASKWEEVEATTLVSKKNEIIKPRPWTFPKTSPWVLGSLSSLNTSPDPSATKVSTSNGPREMLGMYTRLEQENDSFDNELEKGKSGYIGGFAEDLIGSPCVEDDLQPMVQVENHTFLEEGSIGWDDYFCLDFNFWETLPAEGNLFHDANSLYA